MIGQLLAVMNENLVFALTEFILLKKAKECMQFRWCDAVCIQRIRRVYVWMIKSNLVQ